MPLDHYKALGVPRSATQADIKKAFRTMAAAHHPDKGGDPEVFRVMREAHDVLSDPAARQAYDQAESKRPVTRLRESAENLVDAYFQECLQPLHP